MEAAGLKWGEGLTAVVWASEPGVQGNVLDVMGQVYDAMGNPIGGEITVNTDTTEAQDRPSVAFLPAVDAQGRPQFIVLWRDTDESNGGSPRGTGVSYKCFSIDGVNPPNPMIFEDGFESGDTTSWSDTQQP